LLRAIAASVFILAGLRYIYSIALRLHVLPCDKFAPLDKKIEHYQKLLLGIADQLTVDRIESLIADLQAQKGGASS
jgi:hypothetical protein